MHKSNLLLKGLMLGVTASMYPAFGNATATSPATNNVANVQQESTTVTGIVLDDMGEPIIGATIKIKGQDTVGTITSIDGDFTLKGLKKGQTLVISYIGFQTQEVKYNGEKSLKVTLKSDSKSLNEVVVVGYGTQKKVNMSGAVASINMDELTESRPVTNVSQALAGLAAGVNVSSSSNRPGDDNASILVRGQGTLNSSAPLIIIDGVEQGINTVNPQDIESVSVLKDAASASIYGSRAANGVILITTKKGKSGKIKVDYNGYVSFQSIRKTLTPVSNYADYMELINEGYYNSNPKSGKNQYFSEDKIAEWRNGNDPLKYPNTNWIDETFKPSTSTNHVVSLSGGSDKIRFYGSFGYMNNPGVLENAGMKKYTVRLNMDADVTSWLNIGMQIGGYVSDLEPGAEEIDNIFTYTAATTPGMVFRAPDGRYGALNNS